MKENIWIWWDKNELQQTRIIKRLLIVKTRSRDLIKSRRKKAQNFTVASDSVDARRDPIFAAGNRCIITRENRSNGSRPAPSELESTKR